MAALENINASQTVGQENILDFYQTWAETYEKDIGTLPHNGPDIIATAMAALYPPESRDLEIIDVCAGTGLVGQKLRVSGFTTIDALDGCEAMLKKAGQKQVYRKLICDRLGPNRLNIDDNRYDALTGTGMFVESHVKEDCLTKLIRIVKLGGRLVFAMSEKYIRDKTEFFKNLEPTMKRHEDSGLWRMVERKIVPKYLENDNGLVFIFEVV